MFDVLFFSGFVIGGLFVMACILGNWRFEVLDELGKFQV